MANSSSFYVNRIGPDGQTTYQRVRDMVPYFNNITTSQRGLSHNLLADTWGACCQGFT